SQIVFGVAVKARAGAEHDWPCLGRGRDQGDHPARWNACGVGLYGTDYASDNGLARPDGCRAAVELGDTETPDLLLVGGFIREHEALLCFMRLSPFIVSQI